MKILVKSDVYDICNRIKKFDATYRLVFNTLSNAYEVYSTALSQSVEIISGVILSYVCTLPYNQLDERAIRYLYDTSVDNLEDIIKQIDKHNQVLEQQNDLQVVTNTALTFENRLRQLT